MRTAPESLATVLHYANAKPTEQNWQGVVLGPHAQTLGLPAAAFEQRSPMGVSSLQDFRAFQDRLRAFLRRLTHLEGVYARESRALAEELLLRARPELERWAFSPSSERLLEIWSTKKRSFEESVYLALATALMEMSFRDIGHCDECEEYFFKPSERDRKFCSNRCRNRAMVRQHRQRRNDEASAKKRGPRKK